MQTQPIALVVHPCVSGFDLAKPQGGVLLQGNQTCIVALVMGQYKVMP